MPEQRVAGGADATRGPCASHAAARSAASVVDELRLPQRTGDVWRPGGDDVVLVLLLDVAVAVRAADSDVAVDAALSLTAWSIEHMRGSASICYTVWLPWRVAEDNSEGSCLVSRVLLLRAARSASGVASR